jgi:hypothetical protein
MRIKVNLKTLRKWGKATSQGANRSEKIVFRRKWPRLFR